MIFSPFDSTASGRGRSVPKRRANIPSEEPLRSKNRIVPFEIPVNDPRALTKVLHRTLWLEIPASTYPRREYWLCETGSDGPGINGAAMQRHNAGEPVTNCVDVASIDAALQTAVKLGAQVAFPKMPVPGVGAVAAIIDP